MFHIEEEVDKPSEVYVKKRIDLFSVVDLDNNYRITLKELQSYYKDKHNKNGKFINAELRFYGLDTNEDDFIELAEFATFINWKIANQKYRAKKQIFTLVQTETYKIRKVQHQCAELLLL